MPHLRCLRYQLPTGDLQVSIFAIHTIMVAQVVKPGKFHKAFNKTIVLAGVLKDMPGIGAVAFARPAQSPQCRQKILLMRGWDAIFDNH